MNRVTEWLAINWNLLVIPSLVFVLGLIALFWLRKLLYGSLENLQKRSGWQSGEILLKAGRSPSTLWCLIVSIYLGMMVSELPAAWKVITGKSLWTLLMLSLGLFVMSVTNSLIMSIGPSLRLPVRGTLLIRNVSRVFLLVLMVLAGLDIWGVPTTSLFILIAALVLIGALALRDALPNLFAGIQLSSGQQIKAGDYVKLETGEEGEVEAIDWSTTRVKTLDEKTVIIPNVRMVQRTVINYGHPLKKAKEPFRFNSRTEIRELTSLKASNLRELADTLKTAPDAVVYYHTHSFLEEHQYLTPEPANDFAVWVTDALGEESLGERLASVDTFEFSSIGGLRERLVGIIEECISQNKTNRQALEGREFYFIRSISVIFPTSYVAHDLREFAETLRKISPGSLFFHVFEAKLRLGRGLNDFSVWLRDSLDEPELAAEIAKADPYTYTLEGLRSLLIQKIEKHVK